ncbi:unnamed protein product [Rhizoctonia solani]|uniref:CHAT domain-containing protein n=1 Tax=Rhizoctonia solani TaxID=456999 RepID=A0A8H3AP66_9AGAM|nr:unnamed protein product [Rhizoctonia solani]
MEKSQKAHPDGNQNALPSSWLELDAPGETTGSGADNPAFNPGTSKEQKNAVNPQCQCLGTFEQTEEIHPQGRAGLHTPEPHTQEPPQLVDYAQAYMDRFESSNDPDDINIAIDYYIQAISLASDAHPSKPDWYLELGNTYYYKFQRLGQGEDINKAIDWQRKATLLTPNGHPSQSTGFYDLGVSYNDRYELQGSISDLHNAIHYLTESLTPEVHKGKAGRLSYLGNLYQTRFESLRNFSDANNAIKCLVEAVSLAPDSDTDKPLMLNNLGNSYRDRFSHSGDLSDIRHSIDFLEQATSLIREDHEVKSGILSNLGSSYQARFEQLGDPDDLDKAIECTSQAVSSTPSGFNRLAMLNNLGVSHRSRFDHRGTHSDLSKSIDYLVQAIPLVPVGHSFKPVLLNNLGNSYQSRFECLGEPTDANHAIDYLLQAISVTPDAHPEMPGRLNNLGNALCSRFSRIGDLPDIDNAIKYLFRSVSLTSEHHPDKPKRLNNLGISYKNRFLYSNELSDVNNAVECLAEAISLTPDNKMGKQSMLNNLGNAYQSRLQYLGEITDAHKSIECLSQAISLTPNDHAEKPAILTNLGNSYRSRFERQHNDSDISESIDYLLRAIELTPDGHARRPVTLQCLGASYLTRFQLLNNPADIKNAIQYLTQAVTLTQNSNTGKPSLLIELGSSYQSRLETLPEPQDLENAVTCFREAAEANTGPPHTRLKASRRWARLAHKYSISDPLAAYKRALELIPQIVWIDATIDHRYRLVKEIGDLASEAASCAISLRDFDHALEWLEQGRSIVWNQLLKLRDPFNKISAIDPSLAQALKEVGKELERAGSRTSTKLLWINYNSDVAIEARRHHQLASEWDRLLQQARLLPQCGSFLLPPRAKELKRAARDGPVVVINTYEKHCDALIILPGSDQISHVPLVDFSRTKVIDISEQLGPLIGHRGSTRVQAPSRSKSAKLWEELLRALWSDVAKPVLDFLGCKKAISTDKLMHVTWCTTGRLSFLPLHAAGPYDQSSANVFDLVVSSYTPTLSTLLSLSSSALTHGTGVLAVGQEQTPGFASLPYTQDELCSLKGLCKSIDYMELSGINATIEAVLNNMEKYSWVHLACHATQHTAYPTHSAFHLYDGSLKLSDIIQKSFKNKGLAFLSACHTATGDKKLPDEAIHLAAGMLIAGYPSVIATMWSMRDMDGPEISQQIYEELLKDEQLDCTSAARALHGAVKKLRDRVGVALFSRWIPFVHFGC